MTEWTYKKLNDGSWGAKCFGRVGGKRGMTKIVGTEIEIKTRRGETHTRTVNAVEYAKHYSSGSSVILRLENDEDIAKLAEARAKAKRIEWAAEKAEARAKRRAKLDEAAKDAPAYREARIPARSRLVGTHPQPLLMR